MKTYRHYRVGLFIGLLSFSTLSSCVNTRQELGVNNRRQGNCWERVKEWAWPNGTGGNMRRGGYKCSTWPASLKCGIPVFATLGTVGAWLLYYYTGSQSNAIATNTDIVLEKCWNGTATLSNTGSNMTSQQEAFIMRAIENRPAGLVNGSTTEASFISNTPQAESEDLFSGSVIQDQFANTTGQPETGVAKGGITSLGPKTREALKKSGASLELIKCLDDNKVSVNAVDTNGCTMLNAASTMNNTESVEFLVAQEGVDMNISCNSSYYKNPIGE